MKKVFSAALAAVLAAGTAFSSLAAAQPGTSQARQNVGQEFSLAETGKEKAEENREKGVKMSATSSNATSVPAVNRSPEGGRWAKSGESYRYYYDNGVRAADCWLEIEWNNTKNWYYFDRDGVMAVGWMQDAQGGWFYLNPSENGIYGSMVTGWNFIDGNWYYFNEKSDGFKGMMLYSTTTPDGYELGADGAWIQ